MVTVVTDAAIGRSCSAGYKAGVESSRGIFDNRTMHLHGNTDLPLPGGLTPLYRSIHNSGVIVKTERSSPADRKITVKKDVVC